MDEPSSATSQRTTSTRALDGASWDQLLERWARSGAAMMSRFNALNQLRALGGLESVVAEDLASFDAAVELYLDEIRSAWDDVTHRPDDAAHGPPDVDLTAVADPTSFIADLVADPADPPATALFVGFRGEASEQGQTRFYVDPALTAFIDVTDDAVLLQHEVPAAAGSMGGTYVWLRRDPDIVERLRTALGDAARLQAEVWNTGTPAVAESTAPWTTASNGSEPSGVTISSIPTTTATDTAGSPDDIPLPPGWPTA